MHILILYGAGTDRKKYIRTFKRKYTFLFDAAVDVTFKSLRMLVDNTEFYDAVYADSDTISETDKHKLARYFKHYTNINCSIFSFSGKTKLSTHIISPVRGLK